MAAALAIGGAEAKTAVATGVVKVATSSSSAVELVPAPVAVAIPAAPATAAVPACARRVKVIYSGYGEADRAACAVASGEASR